MGKYSLPGLPGFRFHPTDVELVKYYLKWKVLGKKFPLEVMAEIDIYKHPPWDLPALSSLQTGDLKWFFFSPIEKKYARGARLNRATVYGYWKTTGKDRPVMYNGEVVGMIKTLVFHQGKAPHGDRTDWVMHEYRIEEKGLADRGVIQDTYVLCVVFNKDGMGHRNGAQYGAPFKEEDWNIDDEDIDVVGTASVSSSISKLPFGGASSSHVPEKLWAEASVNANATVSVTIDSNAPSPVVTDANAAFNCLDSPQVPAVLDATAVLMEDAQLTEVLEIFTEAAANDFEAPLVSDDGDILSLLASFTEDNNLNSVLYPFE